MYCSVGGRGKRRGRGMGKERGRARGSRGIGEVGVRINTKLSFYENPWASLENSYQLQTRLLEADEIKPQFFTFAPPPSLMLVGTDTNNGESSTTAFASSTVSVTSTMTETETTNTKLPQCGIKLVRVGRAIAVDLSSSIPFLASTGINITRSRIHSTVLYRDNGFTDDELRAVIDFRNEWLSLRGRPCSFDASQMMGPHSNYIKGELETFIEEARVKFLVPFMCCVQRIPHVSLRKNMEDRTVSE
jgi:hypothetical protein